MRVYLEKVKGVYQGMVFPFREGFSSGILRLCWGSDGSLFAGMTSRGWSSTGGGLYGLQRLVWNGKTPFEMKTVQARPDGFEIEFTQPVDEKTARDAASWELNSFTYQYHHNYGSPVINIGSCPVKAIAVSADRLKVRLVVDSMRLGYIHEIRAEGLRSTDRNSLLHNYGYYTLNRLPDGASLAITPENKVKSPAPQHHHMMMAGTKGMPGISAKAITGAKHLTRQPADWTTGPDRSILIGTKPGLKFDVETIMVKAGARVKLTFRNNDDMLHNLVITKPASADKVGQLAVQMGLNGEKMSFIPASPDILFHTILLHPKESDTIYFTAPEKPGQYTYICSYPGHYMVMRGVLKVVPR
jgi:azurin